MIYDITHAITSLCPTASWSMSNNDYSTLFWNSTDIPIPSLEDLLAEVNRLNIEQEKNNYKILRATEYPKLEDFADAYYWQQNGDDTKMQKWLADCEFVKNKYPKN